MGLFPLFVLEVYDFCRQAPFETLCATHSAAKQARFVSFIAQVSLFQIDFDSLLTKCSFYIKGSHNLKGFENQMKLRWYPASYLGSAYLICPEEHQLCRLNQELIQMLIGL